MDISLIINEVKFNYRVGAILKWNNKILIEQAKDIDFAVIPGGRVHLLEDSKTALDREIKEELGIDVSNIPRKFISVIENFFVLNNIQYHEMYFIYKYDLDSNYNIVDGTENLDSHNSKYYWKDLNKINEVVLLPKELNEISLLDDFKKYVVRN